VPWRTVHKPYRSGQWRQKATRVPAASLFYLNRTVRTIRVLGTHLCFLSSPVGAIAEREGCYFWAPGTPCAAAAAESEGSSSTASAISASPCLVSPVLRRSSPRLKWALASLPLAAIASRYSFSASAVAPSVARRSAWL